jgi:hypothetical protein
MILKMTCLLYSWLKCSEILPLKLRRITNIVKIAFLHNLELNVFFQLLWQMFGQLSHFIVENQVMWIEI